MSIANPCKDHKGWSVDMGTTPPSRPVASAGSGQNDNFSENVSQSLEPVTNTWRGGMEANSTMDVVDKIEELNKRNENKPFDDIDLAEVDAELDRQHELKNSEKDVDTLDRQGTNAGPVKIDEKSAKQDLQPAQTSRPPSKLIPGIRFGLSKLEKGFYEKVGLLRGRLDCMR